MNDVIMERQRKAPKSQIYIRYRQEDIVNGLGIPRDIVRKITKEYDYEHGKEKSVNSPKNLNNGQTVNPIIDYGKKDYLDKYNF